MFKHESPAVNRLVILAPTPVGVDLLVLPTTAALLDVEVIAFVISIDNSAAAVAPDYGQPTVINVDMHVRLSISCSIAAMFGTALQEAFGRD